MLRCRRCDGLETLDVPFIEGVCCDCLRHEATYAPAPGPTAIEQLVANRGGTSSQESVAVEERPALPSWQRSFKLHMRDYFWLTLLLALLINSYLHHRAHQATLGRVQLLNSQLSSSELHRSRLQLDLNQSYDAATNYYRERDLKEGWQKQARTLAGDLNAAESALARALIAEKSLRRRDASARREFERLGICEYWHEGQLELLVPGYPRRYTMRSHPELANYYPTD